MCAARGRGGRCGVTMSTLEDRVSRLEALLSEVFRPGGTIAIRDENREPAALIIGNNAGDIGSVLMSVGLSVKEPLNDQRVVVTASGIGVKDSNDTLRVLISEQGLLFLDELGTPKTLITPDGIHSVAE